MFKFLPALCFSALMMTAAPKALAQNTTSAYNIIPNTIKVRAAAGAPLMLKRAVIMQQVNSSRLIYYIQRRTRPKQP